MVSGADLCWALGEIICNFTPILPYFQHWGGWTSTTILFSCGNLVKTKRKMQIEHFFSPKSSSKIEHFFSPNSGEDQKKHKVFSKNRTLFSPNLRSAVHPFKLLGGMQMWTILKLLGGIQLNYWGGYIPPGFGTPGFGISVNRIRNSPFTCSISLLIFGMLHSSFFSNDTCLCCTNNESSYYMLRS